MHDRGRLSNRGPGLGFGFRPGFGPGFGFGLGPGFGFGFGLGLGSGPGFGFGLGPGFGPGPNSDSAPGRIRTRSPGSDPVPAWNRVQRQLELIRNYLESGLEIAAAELAEARFHLRGWVAFHRNLAELWLLATAPFRANSDPLI